MNNTEKRAQYLLYSASAQGSMTLDTSGKKIIVEDTKWGKVSFVSLATTVHSCVYQCLEDTSYLSIERKRIEKSPAEFVEMLMVRGRMSFGVVTAVQSQCEDTKKLCETVLHEEDKSLPEKQMFEWQQMLMQEEALWHIKEKIESVFTCDHSCSQVVIVIAGASASGKSSFAESLAQIIPYESQIVGTDHYYRAKCDMEKNTIESFDDPRALDSTLFQKHLAALMQGQTVQKVKYDFKTSDVMSSDCEENFMNIQSKPVLIVEGIFNLREEFLPPVVPGSEVITVAVYAEEEELILRRIMRDSLSERKSHTPAQVLLALQKEVLPSYRKHILPSLQKAQVHVYNPQR